jgi:hypothetical protein
MESSIKILKIGTRPIQFEQYDSKLRIPRQAHMGGQLLPVVAEFRCKPPTGAVKSYQAITSFPDSSQKSRIVSEIRRTAPAYYVQTPNYWFPVETHQVSLFLHWLPQRIERRLVRYLSVWGLATWETQENIDKWLAYNNLLTKRDMVQLFPDAEILVERFLLLPKSLIAAKRPAQRSSQPE